MKMEGCISHEITAAKSPCIYPFSYPCVLGDTE